MFSVCLVRLCELKCTLALICPTKALRVCAPASNMHDCNLGTVEPHGSELSPIDWGVDYVYCTVP